MIEKKEDVKNGRYTVLFKAIPQLVTEIKASVSRQELVNGLEPALDESKDPLVILDMIHAVSQVYFIGLLEEIQQNKNISTEKINFFEECFLWPNYKQYTSKLIEASRKIINDLNITQLLINQAKRQIRTAKEELKIYERIKQQENNDKDSLTPRPS
jgi:hypothetical protein